MLVCTLHCVDYLFMSTLMLTSHIFGKVVMHEGQSQEQENINCALRMLPTIFCDLNSHLNCNGRSTPTFPSGWTLDTTVSKMLQVSIKMLLAGVQTEYPQSDSSLCKS